MENDSGSRNFSDLPRFQDVFALVETALTRLMAGCSGRAQRFREVNKPSEQPVAPRSAPAIGLTNISLTLCFIQPSLMTHLMQPVDLIRVEIHDNSPPPVSSLHR